VVSRRGEGWLHSTDSWRDGSLEQEARSAKNSGDDAFANGRTFIHLCG